MTRTQEFIDKNRKILTSGPDFYNPDTSLMSIEDYHKAKCRMLVIFPTPHVVKTVSSTAAALNDFIITHCKDTFIDFAYMPENEDIKRYDDWNVPYAIGNITHLDPSHFDIVGFSISVLHEVVSGPSILSTFDRCDKPIPLFWSQRKDMPIGSVPLIYAGGITAACGESMFGKVNVNGKVEQGYMDFVYLGDCGHTHHITNRLIEALETGKCHRNQSDHDVPGYPHKDIDNFDEVCTINTMQDFVDSLFDMQEIYQPQAYDVEYNKHNRIVKNIKINPKAQDFVKPYYPHEMEPDLGIGRTIINASGDNCGTTQTQCSEGCSAGGHCNFCSEGVYTGGWVEKSHEQIIKESWEAKKYSAGYKYKPYSFNMLRKGTTVPTAEGPRALELATSSNVFNINGTTTPKASVQDVHKEWLEFVTDTIITPQMSKLHRQWVFREGKFEVVLAKDIKEGDYIPCVSGFVKPLKAIRGTKEYFAGLWYGDGSRSGDPSNKWKELRQFVSVKEKSIQELCENSRLFKRCKSETRDNIWCNVYADSQLLYVKEIFPNYKKDITGLSTFSWQQSMDFIAGLFDADGSAHDGVISLSQSEEHKDIIQWVSTVLNAIGCRNSVRKVRWRFTDHSYGYCLRLVGKKSILTYKEFIGFAEAAKQSKIRDCSVLSKCIDRAIPAVVGPYIQKETGMKSITKTSHFFQGKQGMLIERFNELFCNFEGELVNFFKQGGTLQKVTSINKIEEASEGIDLVETNEHSYIAGSVYTHNCNYLTDYKGMLAKWIQIYPKVTFINMRMEELGRDTDAMKIMKAVGSNRLSAPLEGLSPRIQNNMLNKCLSKESTNAFMEEVVHQHLTDLKVGGIFTSYEQDEDFQYICDFVDSFKKKAAAEGGSFPFRLKMCLTGDALTPIPGVGLVRQIDMQEGPVCGYKESIITAVKPQGLCEIYKLVSRDGTVIKGTPEHPVLVDPKHPERPESYKFIKDLKQGDVFYGKIGTEAYGSRCMSEEMCKIIGWYLGDGYVNRHDNFKTCGFCFNKEEKGLHDEIWEALLSQGLVPHVHNHKESILAIRVHNAEFSRMLKGNFGHTAYAKTIEPLFHLNKECQATILKYWFAADGTVVYDRSSGVSRIKLESVNWDILHDTKVVLANMGIASTLRKHKSKCNGKEFQSATLEIRQAWVKKFADEIGIAGVKGSKIVTRERRGTKSLCHGFIKMVVESSDQVADEMTYGFTVENGTYVTNGIVSHNTPLVHYALTPLEYLERKSARNSFNGEHWLTDEWYEKFREHDVHFKVNGFRYSTYLEQSFIDLGRSITDMIYRHFIKGHVKVYSLRSCATDDYLAELRSITDPDGLFGDRDPEHYISPCHRIHVDLMGSYIPRARRILRFKQQGDIFKNEPDIRCLKTFDEAKTKCYHNCIKNDPLMLYNDVTMDEDGNLHGQSYPLYGCERCQTPKQRLARLKRPTPQTKNCDDIIATPRIPQVQKVRFVLKRKSEYDVLNPNNTAHTFMTKFLQLSDNLLHSYHSIVCHNMLWQSAPAFKDYVYGYQIVDTMWSKNSIKEIKELIPEVNKHLKSVQVVSAQEILRDEKLLITDYNTWVFESELPKEQFDGAAHSYKGQIKVEAQVQGFALTETTDSNLMSPVYQQIGGKIYGAFTIPAKYNPVMYLMGYVSQSKKTSEDAIVTSTQFQCITASRETKMPCRNCSEENAMISLITGKPLPFGKRCLSKVVLGQLIKNMN